MNDGCQTCGAYSWGAECWGCRRAREAAEKATKVAADLDWFDRTGHCGGCGQPGNFCQCNPRLPCGCRDLHPMGSGIDADPLATFAEPVPDNQPELF